MDPLTDNPADDGIAPTGGDPGPATPAAPEASASGAAGQRPQSAAPVPDGHDGGGKTVTLDGKADAGTDAGEGGGGEAKPDGAGEIVIRHPEGFTPLPEAEAKLLEYARANGLDQAKTQALADMHMDALRAMGGRLGRQLAEAKKAFSREIEADPEFGGGNLEQTARDANLALRRFGPELIGKLSEYNLECEPNFVRFFARLGRTLRENRSPRGDSPNRRRQRTLADDKAEMLAEEERRNSAI